MSLPDPPSNNPPSWIHTDLVAENILVRHGRLAAVLDFGALAVGHPSVDLIAAWELLGPNDRDVFRSTLRVDSLNWAHGRAWAFAMPIMTFPYYWHDACAVRSPHGDGNRGAQRLRRSAVTGNADLRVWSPIVCEAIQR